MGGSIGKEDKLLEFFGDKDSVVEHGQKGIVSASLEDLDPPLTGQDFLEATLVEIRKFQFDVFAPFLKKTEVEERSPDDFSTRVTLDGEKLFAAGKGRDCGQDKVVERKHVKLDRENGKLTIRDMVDAVQGAWVDEVPSDESAAVWYTEVHALRHPHRVEMTHYEGGKGGHRMANQSLADAMYDWYNPIVREALQAKAAKVKVIPGAKSIREKGAVCDVSEPCGEFITCDTLFTRMVTLVKKGLEETPGTTVTVLSETKFVGERTDGDGKTLRTTVQHSQRMGDIETEVAQDDQVVSTTRYMFSWPPLVVEGYDTEPGRPRVTGLITARRLQRLVNACIVWEGGLFGF